MVRKNGASNRSKPAVGVQKWKKTPKGSTKPCPCEQDPALELHVLYRKGCVYVNGMKVYETPNIHTPLLVKIKGTIVII